MGEDFQKKRIANFLGRVAFIIVNIGSAVLGLADFGLLNLGKMAAAMGKIPILKLVVKLSLETTVRNVLTLGYALCAIDAIQRLFVEDAFTEKIQACLDLLSCIGELALKAFVIFGFANPIVLIVLGFGAAAMGLASFLYRESQSERRAVT